MSKGGSLRVCSQNVLPASGGAVGGDKVAHAIGPAVCDDQGWRLTRRAAPPLEKSRCKMDLLHRVKHQRMKFSLGIQAGTRGDSTAFRFAYFRADLMHDIFITPAWRDKLPFLSFRN